VTWELKGRAHRAAGRRNDAQAHMACKGACGCKGGGGAEHAYGAEGRCKDVHMGSLPLVRGVEGEGEGPAVWRNAAAAIVHVRIERRRVNMEGGGGERGGGHKCKGAQRHAKTRACLHVGGKGG
jgi:hypothetical protein